MASLRVTLHDSITLLAMHASLETQYKTFQDLFLWFNDIVFLIIYVPASKVFE